MDEENGPGATRRIVVESGPVGALVLLLAIDAAARAPYLAPHAAGRMAGFPQGAIEALWETKPRRTSGSLPTKDLVDLARYALV